MYYLVMNTDLGEYYYKDTEQAEAIFTPNKNEAKRFNTKKEAEHKSKCFCIKLYVKEVKNVI